MWEDEEYQGLPFDESPIQERSSVKLFTMSQEDITSRRSNDISKGGVSSIMCGHLVGPFQKC
jgi:hypothetical protein